MNLTIFNRLMRAKETRRHPPEWKMFMEVCDLYLKRKGIKNPVVLEVGPAEIGSKEENQHEFFEQLFKAKCIDHVSTGETIDILSIRGGHYKNVKADFETFSPYCTGIIAIHDIESCRYKKRKTAESWKLWDELKALVTCGAKEYENFLFLTIHRKRIRGNQRGIGVIIKQ